MPNRTAKFVSAVIASFVASAPFATVSRGATPTADTCLASPNNQAPQGSHWYYHIEHPSNRHCWYFRGEPTAAANAPASAPANPPSPNAVAATPSSVALPGAVANARAELTSPQTRDDPDTGIATGHAPTPTDNAASVANAQPATTPDTTMLRSVVASRWPDQLAANAPAVAAPAADNSNANASSQATTPEPAAAAVIPLSAADAPPAKQSGSTQMLIIAIVGALSVAGLAASAVGFGGRRKNRARQIETDRHAIWETIPADRPSSPPFAVTAALRPQIGIPRELRDAADPDDKITEMLVRLARSAQA